MLRGRGAPGTACILPIDWESAALGSLCVDSVPDNLHPKHTHYLEKVYVVGFGENGENLYNTCFRYLTLG